MGQIKQFNDEKLIAGILFNRNDDYIQLKKDLSGSFGPIDFESKEYPFQYTEYYQNEMGTELKRVFLAFAGLVCPERLADIKILTNTLEDRFRKMGKRSVNIDPGLLNLSRLVLASTKNNAQRIPLRKGIYAEITLLYKSGKFISLPWTFPDFASGDYFTDLYYCRELYKKQLQPI